jgi:hypothetical protein
LAVVLVGEVDSVDVNVHLDNVVVDLVPDDVAFVDVVPVLGEAVDFVDVFDLDFDGDSIAAFELHVSLVAGIDEIDYFDASYLEDYLAVDVAAGVALSAYFYYNGMMGCVNCFVQA